MEGVLRGQDGLCKPEACGDFTGVFESHWVTVKVDKRGTCCGRDQPYTLVCLAPGWVIYALFVRIVRCQENMKYEKSAEYRLSEFLSLGFIDLYLSSLIWKIGIISSTVEFF